MKIASFNVNGINGRLPVLLRWLEQAAPDIVCLQELKAPQEKFPEAAIDAAGNGNPAPGPKFEYKLRWFERLTAHAADCSRAGRPRCLPATIMSCQPISMFTSRSDGSMTRSSGRRCGKLSPASPAMAEPTRYGRQRCLQTEA